MGLVKYFCRNEATAITHSAVLITRAPRLGTHKDEGAH